MYEDDSPDAPDLRLDDAEDLREGYTACTLDHECGDSADPCEVQSEPQDNDGVIWTEEARDLDPFDKVLMRAADGTPFELPMESFLQNIKRMLAELTEAEDEMGFGLDEEY